MMTQPVGLTNLQIELLKVFAYTLDEATLLQIRELLAKFFAEKATQRMDEIWQERGYTNETMDNWLQEENKLNESYS
jgi:predicted transcriptional regulator